MEYKKTIKFSKERVRLWREVLGTRDAYYPKADKNEVIDIVSV